MNDTSDRSAASRRPASTPRIGDEAPDFSARTTHGPFRLSALRGRWVMLFSHPADFTPVCTTEFIALAREEETFRAMDCALVGLSVDSLASHIAWIEAIRTAFGVTIPFPVVEDPSMAVARAYGMLDEESDNSATVRGVYVIDPRGIIRAITWYPMSVGRSVAELIRLVSALQTVNGRDVLTPEGWTPGADVVLPPAMTQDEAVEAGPAWFMRFAKDRLA